MRRRILGIAALVSLIVGVVLAFWQPASEGMLAASWQGSMSFCFRMGALFGAAWLAYDDVQRLPGWLLVVVPVALIALARWPKLFLLLLPALILYAAARRLMMPPGDGKDKTR